VRADRLVRLALLLQARGQMTARSLARELEVSVRTIYRDLDALSAAGVPVRAESGPGGGCQLMDGYRFALRALRPEEAEALLILGVPAAVAELGLGGAATAAQRQIRVTAGLEADGGRDAGALVHLDMPRWFRAREEVPVLRTLAEAVRRQRRLALRYRRAGDRGTPEPERRAGDPPTPEPERTVDPLGLVNKAGIWYLVAAAGDGVRVTVYRAGRIDSARVLADRSERPAGFDIGAFWESWSAEFEASRPRFLVRLMASPVAQAAFGEVFGDGGGEALAAAAPADERGWREVTLTFEHELAAAHRLAGFGGEVEVLEPASVSERLLSTARAILDRYDGDPGSRCPAPPAARPARRRR
jgi:predicted DNA-binding transcriptional regulator YafY